MEDRHKGLAKTSEEPADPSSIEDDDPSIGRATEGASVVSGGPPITQVITKAGDDDARFARAWRVWLEALAHDPEAAWAAALTYKSLGIEGREAWIDALEIDAPDVGAPAIALYAPLLGVEDDPARRDRIESALRKQGVPLPTNVLRALRGEKGERRAYVIVHPMYLDFVEVLTCFVGEGGGFADVRHDPIIRAPQAPAQGDTIAYEKDSIELEAVPVEVVVEELAHAVVAHRRGGGVLPAPLVRFADLFTPRPESVDREKLRRA